MGDDDSPDSGEGSVLDGFLSMITGGFWVPFSFVSYRASDQVCVTVPKGSVEEVRSYLEDKGYRPRLLS